MKYIVIFLLVVLCTIITHQRNTLQTQYDDAIIVINNQDRLLDTLELSILYNIYKYNTNIDSIDSLTVNTYSRRLHEYLLEQQRK